MGSTSARTRAIPIPNIVVAVALDLPPDQVRQLVRDQVASLAAVAAERGARLTHVKPHGALYNQAVADSTLARAIALGVRDVDPTLRLVGLCRSQLLEAGIAAGLPVWGEAFVDRAYRPDGSLVPRNQAGAVHTDPGLAVTQALTLLLTGFVRAIDGVTRVPVQPDTLCIHADTPGAVVLARRLRSALTEKGIGRWQRRRLPPAPRRRVRPAADAQPLTDQSNRSVLDRSDPTGATSPSGRGGGLDARRDGRAAVRVCPRPRARGVRHRRSHERPAAGAAAAGLGRWWRVLRLGRRPASVARAR